MNVLALNSSPRGDEESYTAIMLGCLVDGMREAGGNVEVVNLREKKIRNCIGCFTCWTKTPGQCVHKDDMTYELFPKWKASDLVVYASPLYYHTINAAMSAFRERTLPAILPFFEPDAVGKTIHPIRDKIPASVFLSVCGFPEDSEFNPMRKFFARAHMGVEEAGIICRAGASLLSSPFLQEKANDVLDATRQAGRELIEDMEIAPETMDRITQPLGDAESFGKMGNMYWKTCIAEGVNPKEFSERKMVPRPDTLEDFMFVLPYGLDISATGDERKALQFHFSGDVEDSCYFMIEDGKVNPARGIGETPDLTIRTPFGLWVDIMTGKTDGAQMFMEQKYQVEGDLDLMMRLFRR